MEIRTISREERETLLGREIVREDERARATKTHEAAQRIFDELLRREKYSAALDFSTICEELDVPYLVMEGEDRTGRK